MILYRKLWFRVLWSHASSISGRARYTFWENFGWLKIQASLYSWGNSSLSQVFLNGSGNSLWVYSHCSTCHNKLKLPISGPPPIILKLFDGEGLTQVLFYSNPTSNWWQGSILSTTKYTSLSQLPLTNFNTTILPQGLIIFCLDSYTIVTKVVFLILLLSHYSLPYWV